MRKKSKVDDTDSILVGVMGVQVFQLVGTLAHRRFDYARRVHKLELLVRTGLYKAFAVSSILGGLHKMRCLMTGRMLLQAQGFHLQPLSISELAARAKRGK